MERFMHAKMYDGQDVTGWLMSEKLNGVRAMWTGSQLLSRTGKVFNAPDWFKAALPKVKLDGELYIGRGVGVRNTVGKVRRKVPRDAEWEQIRFHVFDLPDDPRPFAGRLDRACKILSGNPVARVVDHLPCFPESLASFYASIMAGGGEAVMLKKPDCQYTPGRSSEHLKYFGERVPAPAGGEACFRPARDY